MFARWLRLLCIPIILGCYILCARSRTTTLYGVVSVSSVCAATFATSIVASYTGSSVSKCVSVMVQVMRLSSRMLINVISTHMCLFWEW